MVEKQTQEATQIRTLVAIKIQTRETVIKIQTQFHS